jgi:CDP-diacylglycerol pyrophosphatase
MNHTKSQNYFFAITKKVLCARKAFRAIASKVSTHLNSNDHYGFPMIVNKSNSFIVDWQLTK